jgi:hypothetical protein
MVPDQFIHPVMFNYVTNVSQDAHGVDAICIDRRTIGVHLATSIQRKKFDMQLPSLGFLFSRGATCVLRDDAWRSAYK